MKLFKNPAWLILFIAFTVGLSITVQLEAADKHFRVLSWNISGDAFVNEQSDFHALLRWGDPDIVLLDEVDPSADPAELKKALMNLRADDDNVWHVNFGASGGRQRDIIASRIPQEELQEFSKIVAYPDEDQTKSLHWCLWKSAPG